MTKPLVRVVIPVIPGTGTGNALLREYRFRTIFDPDLLTVAILPVFPGDADQVQVFNRVATELRGLEADQSLGAPARGLNDCVEVTVLRATLTRGNSSMLGAACGFIAARAADPAQLRPLTATGALTLPKSWRGIEGRLGDCIVVQPVAGLRRKLQAIMMEPLPPRGLLIALPATDHPDDATDLACISRLIAELQESGYEVLRAGLLSQVLAAWIPAAAWQTPELALAYAGAAMPVGPRPIAAEVVKRAHPSSASVPSGTTVKRRVVTATGFVVAVVAAVTALKSCSPEDPLVLIPPGSFTRGVPLEESRREGSDDSDARPVRIVTLTKSFWLAKNPVTRGQYAVFARETGRILQAPPFTQSDDHPAVNVGWPDAVAYVDWLSRRTRQHYRLPTEAEWEWAARGNTATARFWGDSAERQCDHANGADQALLRATAIDHEVASCDDGYANTSPGGSFPPNRFGLNDMLGNVFQWTADCYRISYADVRIDGSAETGGSCSYHVARGGSWRSAPAALRAGVRTHQLSLTSGEAGFRIARDDDRR